MLPTVLWKTSISEKSVPERIILKVLDWMNKRQLSISMEATRTMQWWLEIAWGKDFTQIKASTIWALKCNTVLTIGARTTVVNYSNACLHESYSTLAWYLSFSMERCSPMYRCIFTTHGKESFRNNARTSELFSLGLLFKHSPHKILSMQVNLYKNFPECINLCVVVSLLTMQKKEITVKSGIVKSKQLLGIKCWC